MVKIVLLWISLCVTLFFSVCFMWLPLDFFKRGGGMLISKRQLLLVLAGV